MNTTGIQVDGSRAEQTSSELLSGEACRRLCDQVISLGAGGGLTRIALVQKRTGSVQWAKNRIATMGESQTVYLWIVRMIRGAIGESTTTRLDSDGLRQAVQSAEQSLTFKGEAFENVPDTLIDDPIAHPTLWSNATFGFSGDARGELAVRMAAVSESAGMASAGDIQVSAQTHATLDSSGLFRFYPVTDIQCSMTARNAKASASGWAGMSHYDFAKIDPARIASRAVDKAVRSANPVGLEPGRYTAILEPQAVADLSESLVGNLWRPTAEMGIGPFAMLLGQSKIGQRVLDPRLTLRSDCMDPDGGFVPFQRHGGEPYRAVTWIQDGVLRELGYRREYALAKLGIGQALLNPLSARLSGPKGVETSIEEMIASTDRGILVTRLGSVRVVDLNSLLSTGFTRDGLWLIERGKVVRAIKNFRFTESPMFVLNNVRAIGAPVRVYHPTKALVMPAMKVLDFSFTSIADAV